MSEFRKGFSHAETRRLKSWPPGRLSQLTLWIQHLQEAFDVDSLAGQVAQSNKREFSEFVPKIVPQDINFDIEFNEIRITWKPPKGLRFFLFYDIQISLFENFAQFDSFVSADPLFVFPNLLNGTTYYVRVRVVNKDNLFGPWSDTLEIETPFASGSTVFDQDAAGAVSFSSTTFQPFMTREYTAVGGKVYYGVDYEFYAEMGCDQITHKDAEFRWVVDGVQVGRAFNLTSISSFNVDLDAITDDIGTFYTDSLRAEAPFILGRRGTFMQQIQEIGEGNHVIRLEGRMLHNIHPTANDWTHNNFDGDIVYNNEKGWITLRNFFLFELLLDD